MVKSELPMKMMRNVLAVIFATTLIIASAPSSADTSKENIRAVQTMLTQCGFNPGPADGIWGKKTGAAASNYIHAHGGKPTTDTGNSNLLMAQVDFYRVGDAGPCPAPGEAKEETAKDDPPQTVKKGQPEQDLKEDTDFAKETESSSGESAEDIIEWLSENISGDHYMGLTSGYVGYKDHTLDANFQVDGDTLIHTYGLRDRSLRIPLRDIKGVSATGYAVHQNATYRKLDLFCLGPVNPPSKCKTNASSCAAFPNHSRDPAYRIQYNDFPSHWQHRKEYQCFHDSEWDPDGWTSVATLHLPKDIVDDVYEKFRTLTAINRGEEPAITKKSKCFEWADLGSITPGAWINGNGFRSEAFKAGDFGEAYSNGELAEHFTDANDQCIDHAETAMDQAIRNMIVVGRQATDVANEKKEIKNYFQGQVDRCQGEFKRRYGKYAGKICE